MGEESKVLRIISKRVADGSGSIIGVFIATSAIIGLRTFTRKRVATDGLTTALLLPSAPALQMSHFGRARRFSLWFLALLFHTTNALLYVLKMEEDRWCLLMKVTGLGITLIFCIGLVILLHQSFAVTKDVWICCAIFGSLYVVTAAVTLFKIPTWSDIVLGLIHTVITVFMSILRFSCQAGFLRFEKFPFIVAILGFIGGCLPFIPLPEKLSEISAYKVAAFIGGLFRLLDVIFIMGLTRRDRINRFLVRLQEFLI